MTKTMIEVPVVMYDEVTALMLFDAEEMMTVEPYAYGGKVDERYIVLRLKTRDTRYVLAMTYDEFKELLTRSSQQDEKKGDAQCAVTYYKEDGDGC